MSKFFISRAGEEREWGVWVAHILKEAGHDTFLQDEDILVGQSFPDRERRGLEEADHVIALLSPDYFSKPHTMAEFESAWAPDPQGKTRPLIPVRVRACDVPKPYSTLVYLDIRERDDNAKRKLLAAIGGPVRKNPPRLMVAKLPTVDPTLIGREPELAKLDEAWSDTATNFIQIIASGGTGKTALVDKWFRRHIEEATVFGWSFYRQGTGENRQTSSDPFFAEVLPFFGITVPPTATVYSKAELLARHLREEPVLLILDGIEPLQDLSGPVRDSALKALLQELATSNRGLVVCTTRIRITDIPDDPPRTDSIGLDNLDPVHGAEYLRKLGVQGTDGELQQASKDYANHALALTLLGTYLVDFCNADVRRRTDIPKLIVDEVKQGVHARHVMEAYARMLEGKPELDILRALAYFDRPAEPAALKLVMPAMPDLQYRAALNRLRDARLILKADPSADIDCHPLVREHFAEVMRSTSPEAFRDGHSRLYEHYSKQAPYSPDTLGEMTPLFYAVYHGCRANRHVEALNDVHLNRIYRGEASYLWRTLGAHGTNLSLLANLFDARWTQPVPSLSFADGMWVINEAAFALRALGRLSEALGPTRANWEAADKANDWKNAATAQMNLSRLHLRLGNLVEACASACRSIDYADRSKDQFQRVKCRTTLADAFHQSGALGEATSVFDEAERLQSDREAFPILAGVHGYRYCDLLLTQGRKREVLDRAALALKLGQHHGAAFEIGLNHLSIGRAHPPCSLESNMHLGIAVGKIREAGRLDHLPLALLARATPQDLEEAYTIASRSGMRLYLADYHLAMARRLTGDAARDHFLRAEALVNETGYHRRDPELAELRRKLYDQDSETH